MYFFPPIGSNQISDQAIKAAIANNVRTFLNDWHASFLHQAYTIDKSTLQFYNKFETVLKNFSLNNYKQIFLDLFQGFSLKKFITKSHLCAKIFTKGMKAFRCKKCMYQDNSIQCVQCFQESDHIGHNYQCIDVSGGCCDCGDDQKWSEQGFCNKHLSQNNKVIVDQNQTNHFIKRYQFCFTLLIRLYQLENKNTLQTKNPYIMTDNYGFALIDSLIKFNENSLISNYMTTTLLLQQQSFQNIKQNLLAYLFDFFSLSQTVQKLTELYILLFGVENFKLTLTEIFFKKYNYYYQKSSFHSSSYGALSCQLFTSHKVIKKLVESNKIDPIRFAPSKDLKFQDICNQYSRFCWDLSYLSKLYQGAAEIYLTFHMLKGNISELPTYRTPAQLQPDSSIDYFGIQKIYLENVAIIIGKLKNDKMVLSKMIKDLYGFSATYQPKNLTVYIPQERTLLLSIFAYLGGDLNKLKNNQVMDDLIKIMGISPIKWNEEIKIIMSKINFVLQYQAMVLSDDKDMSRYFSFYSFNFRRIRLVNSSLYQLVLVLNYIIKYLSKNEHSIADYLYFQTTDWNKKLWPENTDSETENQSYYRKKKLKKICKIMGTYVEISCTNTSELVLGNILSMNKTDQVILFYQSLLSNYKNVLMKDFKAIKQNYLQENEIFEEFIKKMTTLQNGKVQIKQQFIVTPLCSYYTDSFRKLTENIVGEEKVPISQISQSLNTYTIGDFMNETTIDMLTKTIKEYAQMMKRKPRQDEKVIINQFVVEITKIRLLLKKQCFDQILMIFFQTKQLSCFLDPNIKSIISSIFNKQHQAQSIQEMENQATIKQQKKLKALEIKQRKMEQIKQKQKKASKNWGSEGPDADTNNQQLFNSGKVCILCKESQVQNPLVYLGFMHRSNLYELMKPQQKVKSKGCIIISSCYHTLHSQCYEKVYGLRDYFYCFLCRNPANIFIPIHKIIDNSVIIQNKQKCFQRMEIINEDLKSKNHQAIKRALQIQQQQQNDSEQLFDGIIGSLVNQINGVWTAFPEVFMKKRRIYCEIFEMMVSIIQQKQQEKKIIKKIQELKKQLQKDSQLNMNKQQQLVWQNNTEIQKLSQLYILQCFIRKFQNIQIQHYNSHKVKSNNSIILDKLASLRYFIDCIAQTNLQIEYPLSNTILQKAELQKSNQRKFLLRIPDRLNDLATEMGKCVNCNHVTNLIYICMICKWKGCQGCKVVSINNHSHLKHLGVCIFVKVATGNIVLICGGRGWIQPSIYENYMGQAYSHPLDRQKYTLNHNLYLNYIDMLLLDQVEQTVRYNQQKYNKQGNTQHL